MMAWTCREMKSWIWLTGVAESPPASETWTVIPSSAALASTDCLIWLKKSACRLATARPIRRAPQPPWPPPAAFGAGLSRLHAARLRATSTPAATTPIRRRFMSGLLKRAVGVGGEQSVRLVLQHVDHHGQGYDETDHDLLDERRDAEQIEPVPKDADDQDTDNGAGDAANAAAEARATDDNGGDDVELEADRGTGLGRVEPGGQHHPGKARQESGEDVHPR